MGDETGAPPVSTEDLREELERLRLLHSISQEFSSSLDFDDLLPKVFDSVLTAVGAQGGSIWIAEGDVLRCKLAMGSASQKLVGTTMPVGTGFVGDVARKQRTTIVQEAMRDERFQQRVDRSSTMITTTVMATPMIAKGVTVGAIQVSNKVTGDGIFDDRDRELELARERLAFYESFDRLIHDNIARSGDLLRQAVALRESARPQFVQRPALQRPIGR